MAIGPIASITNINFTYFHKITLVSVFKHDPMITENVLNPQKSGKSIAPVWVCLAVDNFGRNVLQGTTRSKPKSDSSAGFTLSTKRLKAQAEFLSILNHPNLGSPTIHNSADLDLSR
jgi:hypothetical protein